MPGEWPPVWERDAHSIYRACLSLAFVNFCVYASFPFGSEGRIWDLIFFRFLTIAYLYFDDYRHCRSENR